MSTAKRADPELWEKVKSDITRSDKGGRSGQWSARKAQLAVQDYKRRGGRYVGSKRAANSLDTWTKEDWGTRSGGRSRDTGERYLPKAAREALSDQEYRRTSQKKRSDTSKGRQYSSQPQRIRDKAARHRATAKQQRGDAQTSKAELYSAAQKLQIRGRSRMSKAELSHAIEENGR